MKKFAFVILLFIPLISFGQAEKRYRSIIVDSLKALNGGRVDVKDTLLLDSLAVYNTDLSSEYTSRSLVDSAFVGSAISGSGHAPVTLSGTPDYITLSGQDIIRGQIDLGTDITGTTTATSISDFDTEVSNNASVTANTAKVSNVTTNLSEGTTTTTTVDVNSSDGTNATLVAATTIRAGVMTKAKFDEVVVNNAKISNATHTGDVTGATALTIANKAVEIVMLDDGTDGELITWDASGVAATVAVGTSGQILTSNGVGTAPTFQAGGGNTIYSADDNLAGNRIVSQGANTLSFTATPVNAFSVDGTTFSVDASNNRVGIGTATPEDKLTVKGASAKVTVRDASNVLHADLESHVSDGGLLQMFTLAGAPKIALGVNTAFSVDYISTGNDMGLGTIIPKRKFHIEANVPNIRLSDADAVTDADVVGFVEYFRGNNTNRLGFFGYTSSSNENLSFVNETTNGAIDFSTNSTLRMSIEPDGDVSIGTSFAAPTARLNIRGENAASTTDALLIEDNVGTDLLIVENAGNIGIGTGTPATSAILEISSTTGAVLFPRMTTAQRDALTAVNGMVIYNSTLDKLQVRAGGSWVSLH